MIPVNNGSKPDDEIEHYENRGTEAWAVVRDVLQECLSKHMQGEPISVELPNDERLITQLTQRKYRMTSKGKLALERKEDMKKRGLDILNRALGNIALLISTYDEDNGVRTPLA